MLSRYQKKRLRNRLLIRSQGAV